MSRKGFELSHITTGFVAVLVGFTSSVAIIFQAAKAAGASDGQIGSWILALGLGMAITSAGFSLRYKVPVLTAWSTPGAALLVTALAGHSLAEAYGAFVISALLILISGLTGWFEKIMDRIPMPLANAMLAGILVQFGIGVFTELALSPLLVGVMLLVYLLAKRFLPRFSMLLVLLAGTALAFGLGLFDHANLHWSLAVPHWLTPRFSWASALGVALPLFVVTMASQNLPGVAVLRSHQFDVPISKVLTGTGLVNLLLAPFGGFAFNLAAITAAICMGEDAGSQRASRYKAAVAAGGFYLLAGIFGASIVALFAAMPKALVMSLAGLALIATIGSSLKGALADVKTAEPALITFLVTASGMSLWGIGSAFWGLVIGALSLILMRR
ncbi:benzoate/H(+) symporter BenE family transporter [Gallaecimonas mangrovi]|uniref:benzoate/H(+) symporter BenE family transporter n=1 Tax=Gallaecimonas mangrovi TaxID=2291597 RepID=UPI000E1FE547|nr:benzoate/H(+) symporter BenE family transporter [Gallaecimonas mangrovi]